ncbi:MAG: 5-formyltetrahydrofolate cyclo-ligase [Armatimonadia bacterium]
MQPTNLRPIKDALRREITTLRDALSPADRAAKSAAIAARLLDLPDLIEAECVMLYSSFRSEVETPNLIATLLAQGKSVVLPKVNRQTRTLDLYAIMDLEADTAPGPWCIKEPVPARTEPVSPRDLDFVIVPGVAFDGQGHRCGYGGGYYDDLLARLRPRLEPEQVVAAAFELQIVPQVPWRPKDIPVPYIATETRLIRAHDA